MKGRDPIGEIAAYNEPLVGPQRRIERVDAPGSDLTAEAMGRKLEALARSPFSFFRGTFHLMALDVLRGRVDNHEPRAPEGLIVGDLHLENYGAYRGASGALCFDVNDYDDVGLGPVDFDLKRLCTSALLLDMARPQRVAAAKAVAEAWASAIDRLGGRFPVQPWDESKAEPPVRDLLADKGRKEAKLPALDPLRCARAGGIWEKRVLDSIHTWQESLAQHKAELPGKWGVLEVVYRFKGTGSLGRYRFQALIGHGAERRIVEIKEARSSALDLARGIDVPGHRGRIQSASIRRLQGDPWPHVASTSIAGLPALGREAQTEEKKLRAEDFQAQLEAWCRQCGEVLARLHARANAPALLSAIWKPGDAAKAAVKFAESYAKAVEADHAAYLKARPKLGEKLIAPGRT